MLFAKRVFTWAAIWGFLTVPPLWFLEGETVRRFGAPLTYPEWYYGLAWVVLVFQLIYFVVGRDPVRYRPLMPVCALVKLGFGVTVWSLVAMGRTHAITGVSVTPDLIWTVLFVLAYVKTPEL